jgi:hypothetical protein
MFGDDLLVAPITSPMGEENLFVMKEIWLPEGDWFEWSTGTIVPGGGVVTRPFCLDEVPVYARAGAVVPMQPPMGRTGEKPVDPLILSIFPGESGAAKVYEDEGDTDDYKTGAFAFTPVEFEREGDEMSVVVGPAEGGYPGMIETRGYELRLVLAYPPEEVSIDGMPAEYMRDGGSGSWDYDGDELTVRIRTPRIDVRRRTVIDIRFPDSDLETLSGKKGAFRRTRRFMKFLAKNNWDKSVYSNDVVVRAAQTGHRIGLDPSKAADEIRRFEKDWDLSARMIGDCSRERREYVPYVDLFALSNK